MSTIFKKPALYVFLIPLIAGVILLFWPKNSKTLKKSRLEQVEKNLHHEINYLEKEGDRLLTYLDEEEIDFRFLLKQKNFPFFVYKDRILLSWNNYHVVPEHRFISGDYTYKFLRLPRGQYIARKWQQGNYELVGLIPLFQEFRISNKYISPEYNKAVFNFTPLKLTDINFESGYDICKDDLCLFQVNFDESDLLSGVTKRESYGAAFILFSFLCGIGILLFYRRILVFALGLLNTFLILFCYVLAFRLLMLLMDFPRTYIEIPLFDTTAFASSWLNPTLGDLLLNFILILILTVIIFDYRLTFVDYLIQSARKSVWLVIITLFYYTSALVLFLLIQTIYNNSGISLDITQSLSFDTLRIAVFLLLIIATGIMFFLGHLLLMGFDQIKRDSIRYVIFFSGGILFIIIALIENTNFLVPVIIATLILLIAILTRLNHSFIKIRFATYIYAFLWAVAGALIISYSIMELEREQEYENQVRFAERFLIENDALAEYLLYEMNKKVEKDHFIQNILSSPYLGKDVIKNKIRQEYLGGYFDRYDVNIFLFDSQGRSYNPQDIMLRPSDIRFNNQKYETSHSNIFYIDDPNDEIAGRYLDLIEVKKRGLRVGYILLDLRLKKIIPENVYPELLVDHRFLQPFQNKTYSYALFSEGSIVYSSGKYNYSNDFPLEVLSEEEALYEGIQFNGYQHRGVTDSEGNMYVISVPAHTIQHFFSNFSFFFLLLVFVVIVISLIYAVYFLIIGVELYYSARIQLYLSLAFFVPMLVVTIITLSLVSRSFKEDVNREYEKKAEIMARNIANDVENSVYENQLVNLLLRASRYSNADANIFSPAGKLLVTSQPMIFENNLLAPYINPEALLQIRFNNRQIYTAREAVGSLEFNTTYHEIRSPEEGNLLGILSVPYFQSEAALEKNRIEIFTNIISIFTIIFLLFLLISYLASEYLIFPLKIITRKLQKTSLEFNEPLSWEANDEIGLMVKEYNRMVMNLEESKKALARTEKESAWREMAQQVAHEIKNPLTPMKLTLQHMQRTISGKDEHFKKSINTLLHQVDTLSEIAGSFSAFARMPAPTKERFDLQRLISKSISLFSNREELDISFIGERKKLIVEADEQLMGRIISNIIINAIEAGEGYHPLKIIIKAERQNRTVLLSIADNGPGIEESAREKIFIPHFSTKKTGSGIGLAIARRGVEHAGGEIWFETEEGVGTTFYISLPLVHV